MSPTVRRIAGAASVPCQFLALPVMAVGMLMMRRNLVVGGAFVAVGIACLLGARALRHMRWPNLAVYLQDPRNRTPRKWAAPPPSTSSGRVVWLAVQAVIEPWVFGRRARANKAYDGVSLATFAGPADGLAQSLSGAELEAVRRSGELPATFWDRLLWKVSQTGTRSSR